MVRLILLLTYASIGGDYVDYQIYWNQGASVNSWALLTSSTSFATSYTTSTALTTG